MKKTLITAAAIAMSASVAGIAYAATPATTPTDGRSVVLPATSTDDPAGDRGRGRDHAEDDVTPTTIPTLPGGDDRGTSSQGMDDPATHDVGDDHGGDRDRGRGADDPATHDMGDDRGGADAGPGSADSGPGSANSGRGGADDPATHDAGYDHGGRHGGSGGSGRGGADDPANHDAGDDHGSGGHGADD
jgi:merozoite surface protein 4